MIEIGKEGEIIPLITFNDMFPLSIKYFSFAAWNGVEAKFLYDCPIPGTESAEGKKYAISQNRIKQTQRY